MRFRFTAVPSWNLRKRVYSIYSIALAQRGENGIHSSTPAIKVTLTLLFLNSSAERRERDLNSMVAFIVRSVGMLNLHR